MLTLDGVLVQTKNKPDRHLYDHLMHPVDHLHTWFIVLEVENSLSFGSMSTEPVLKDGLLVGGRKVVLRLNEWDFNLDVTVWRKVN